MLKKVIFGFVLGTLALEGRAIDIASADAVMSATSLVVSNHSRFKAVFGKSSSGTTPTTAFTVDTSNLTALNSDIHAQQVSDHSLERQVVDGDIPVYTWNVWAFGSPGGFFKGSETDAQKYETGRFAKQLKIIENIFAQQPNAVVCLQEFTNEPADKYYKLLGRALNKLGVTFQYNKMNGATQVGSGNFGLVTLYKTEQYDVVDMRESVNGAYSPMAAKPYSFPFVSNNPSGKPIPQTHRALKVVLKRKKVSGTPISIVNTHLAWGETRFDDVVDSLVAYSQEQGGDLAETPLAVITGDFNKNLQQYSGVYAIDPKVGVLAVGSSYSWNPKTNSQNPPNLADGYIEVRP